MATFDRYVGIDYSGAQTPGQSLPGLRIYAADRASAPAEVPPPPSPRWYWSRREITEWLVARFREDQRTLVGIDHAFSFPAQYFQRHGLSPGWTGFLDDFHTHWPTDQAHVYVESVREGHGGNGAARGGDSRWRRLCELRTRRAKSVFHFNVPGSVATSTHAGLPWLRFIRRNAGDRVHFWPFDGWAVPDGKSVAVEVYPALWSQAFAREGRNSHQHDAYTVAAWMRAADLDGRLGAFFSPSLSAAEEPVARMEGWMLGVM